ncbi:MAG: hypothetical protein ACYDBJ_16045 [Aggregatilineales bacterium]
MYQLLTVFRSHSRLAFSLGLITLVVLLGALVVGPAQAAPAGTFPASALTTNAQAAAPTAHPTLSLISNIREQVLFPMVVRFRVNLALPVASVKAARLNIIQGTAFEQIEDVPLQIAIHAINDKTSLIDYAWPLPIEKALIPFQQVDYQWLITPASGSTVSGTGQFLYADTFRQWDANESAQQTIVTPLTIYSDYPGLALDTVRHNVQQAYELITRNTNIQHTFTLIVYNATDHFCQASLKHPGFQVVVDPEDKAEFLCDPAEAADLYAASGFTLVQRTSPLLEQLQDQIIAHIAEDAYNTLWKAAAEAPPAWFSAGLAQMYGLVGHRYSLMLAREADRSEQLLGLDMLGLQPVSQVNDNGQLVREWNAQSLMLTLYIAAQFGGSAPFLMAQQIAQNGKFADALASVGKGITPTELYEGWKDWLFSSDADSALYLNSYLIDSSSVAKIGLGG